MKLKSVLNIITIVGVVIIAISSFTLSYDALNSLCIANGFRPERAWIFPILLDFAILVYSLASLLRRWQGLGAKMETGCMVVAALCSIGLNTCHAVVHTAMATALHALIPIFVLSSVETLIRLASASTEVQAIRIQKAKDTRAAKKASSPTTAPKKANPT